MRRRLLRLALAAVVVPVAAEAVEIAATRLERGGGPTPASRAVRTAGGLLRNRRR
jgi:hypothetical protein